MAKIVEITQESSISCKAGGEATAEFSVTNITDGRISVGLRVIPDDEGVVDWFTPVGGPEWQFEQGENKPLEVSIKVPQGAEKGSQNFCIEVFSAEAKRGGIDFTTGEKMALQITETPPAPPPSIPWLWIAIAAVLLLVIGGGAAWYFMSGVPNMVGEPFDVAKQALVEKEYAVRKRIKGDAQGEAGVVVAQEKGDKDDAERTIVLLYVPGVEVPKVDGMNTNELLNKLIEVGLGVKMSEKVDNSKPANTVISQRPQPGKIVEKGAVLQVVLAKRSSSRPSAPVVGVFATPLLMNKTIMAKDLKSVRKKVREFERQSEVDSAQPPQQ
jgi:beta-lactam-binding protein with PASTA domain